MRTSVRDEIIRTVGILLLTKSEDEISMNLVADSLGITAPTLYHYFKGKDELLRAGYDLIIKNITSCLSVKFPPSVPVEMKIITATSILADHIMNTGIKVSFLTEDARDGSIILKDLRNRFTEMFSKLKGKKEISAEQMTMRFLALIQADIIYYRNAGKSLPEDFSEKIFNLIA